MEHYLTLLQNTMREQWHKPALSNYHGETFVFADIATEIAKLHIIFKKLGVKPGDKIALASKNSARWAIAFLATNTYHAVAVPILHDFTPLNIQMLTDHSDSVILFTDDKTWEGMDVAKMPKLLAAINLDDYTALYSLNNRLDTVIDNIIPLFKKAYPQGMKRKLVNYACDNLDELIAINYTSGTTSSPKGIMLSARNISSNINFGLRGIPNHPGDTVVSMLPLAHLYGLAFEFIYPVCGGCHVYFLGKTPTPTILLQAFAEVKPYILITVPLVLEKIFKSKVIPILEKGTMRFLTTIPGIRQLIFSTIRKQLLNAFGGRMRDIVVGGAAISKPIEVIMKQVKLPYTVGYGMTECGPLIGYEDWKQFAIKSSGKIVTDMEIRVDSADPHKIVGELQVRGANVMMGYYKNPEATAAAFTDDGWMHTGDLGVIDKKGNIYIKGRSKYMILGANGQNIYPEELEDKFNTMPYVSESIVIERNKRLVAIVSPAVDENHPLDDLRDLAAIMESNRIQINHDLPAYCQISKVEILEEDFLRTPKNSIKRFLYT